MEDFMACQPYQPSFYLINELFSGSTETPIVSLAKEREAGLTFFVFLHNALEIAIGVHGSFNH